MLSQTGRGFDHPHTHTHSNQLMIIYILLKNMVNVRHLMIFQKTWELEVELLFHFVALGIILLSISDPQTSLNVTIPLIELFIVLVEELFRIIWNSP